MSCKELDDRALIRLCLEGDNDGWQELLRRYGRLIYSIPLRRGLDRDGADEVFQSVATTLLQRLHLLGDPSCLPKWLIVTTSRRCNLLEARRRRALVPPTTHVPEVYVDPVDVLAREELQAHVAAALTELPERDREVLLDLFHRELAYTEVAKHLGVAVGTLGSMRARALTRLRKVLHDRGIL